MVLALPIKSQTGHIITSMHGHLPMAHRPLTKPSVRRPMFPRTALVRFTDEYIGLLGSCVAHPPIKEHPLRVLHSTSKEYIHPESLPLRLLRSRVLAY